MPLVPNTLPEDVHRLCLASTEQCSEGRVLPLLLRDLLTHTQARQLLHLELFCENIDDFLEFGTDSTVEEWRVFLVLLFHYSHQRSGLTPLEAKDARAISDYCFRILVKCLQYPHAQLAVAHSALKLLQAEFHVSPDELFGEQSTRIFDELLPPTVGVDPTGLPDPDEVQSSDDETDAHLFYQWPPASRGSSLPGLHADGTVPAPTPEVLGSLPGDPAIYSIDVLPNYARGSLTEADFVDLEAWYENVPRSEGKVLVTEAIKSGKGKIGSLRWVPEAPLKQWMKGHPTGHGSLADVVRFVFPDCPQKTILRRIAGHPLMEPTTTPNQTFVPPPMLRSSLELLKLIKVGKLNKPTRSTVELLWIWANAVDFATTGLLAPEAIAAAGGLPFYSSNSTRQTPKSPINFAQLVQLAFPTASAIELKAYIEQVTKTAKASADAQLNSVKADNEKFEASLRAQINSAAPASPTTKGGSPNKLDPSASLNVGPAFTLPTQTAPDGSLISCHSPAVIGFLRQRNFAQLKEYVRTQRLEIRAGRKDFKRKLVSAEREKALRLQAAEARAYEDTNVPMVYGPVAPETFVTIAGFKFTKSILTLDCFLEDLDYRATAAQLLRSLSASGFPPLVFINDTKLYSPHLLSLHQPYSNACKVYRDFATCAKKPTVKSFWEGPQVLHIKTNIPIHSDIKYRIHIEGYNFGVNAAINSVCVGYAARMLDSVDELEKYGWPAGWNAFTIVHYATGIGKLTQYYSTDGFVTLRCESRCFQAVGFSCSAWLVNHHYGEGFHIGAEVIHQQEDL